MTYSDRSTSSDEGSNDESIESLVSISSQTLQQSFVDLEDDEQDLNSEYHQKDQNRYRRDARETRKSRPKSNSSGRSSRITRSVAQNRLHETRNHLILPIFRIPQYQAGIMWTGNLRRTPVFVFSQNCTIQRSECAEKLGRMFNMTFRLIRAECKLLRSVLQSHGFQESFNHLGRFNLLWTGSHLKPCQLRMLTEFHKVNHFPRSYELTRKDRLAKNVKRFQQIRGLRQFDFLPRTYILPEEFCDFCNAHGQEKGPYIVKPIASSRGRGIRIVTHPEEVSHDEAVIVSRYISNPFLLDGFKFDVRMYVAVTSYEPLVVYIYEEGLVRFATVRYQVGAKHLKTQCMHLTNYSVNKKNFEFVQNDDPNVEDFGNKWSLGALLRFLQSEGADVTGLMVRIEDIIIKSFLCVVSPIASACAMFRECKSKCFELYGFDIIVDENFRPWLLEVNLSPSLACDSPLDFKVKSHMITDLFNLVGIVCHDPTRKTHGGMNILHMKADGQAAVPPKQPTYFVSADEQISSHANLMTNLRPSDYFGHKTARSNACCCTPDGLTIGLAGVASSHLIPKGTSVEETRLMRRIQEEAARAGGWIRLIPNPETWEQYANIWPNENVPWYLGNDRRFYCASTDGSRTSLADSGHSETRRFPANSLLSSAFMASLAVHILHGLVSTVYSNEASDNSDDDSNADSDSWSQSSSPMEMNGPDSVKTKIPCAAQLRFMHPNSSMISVDLTAYLQKTNSKYRINDCQTTWIHNPPVPNRRAVTRSRLPLHNMSHGQMQECLNSLFTEESHLTDVPREQCERVIACYAHTLGHMPFYLRKLGEAPVDLPGLCLRPGCKHDRVRNSTPCGIYQGKRVVPSRPSSVRFGPSAGDAITSDSDRRNSNEACDSVSSLTHRESGRKSRQECAPQEHKRGGLTLDPTKLSATQARHAFAVYLTRIQSRLLFEAKQSSIPLNSSRTALHREHKKLDLMVRFLRKASEHLSLQAIATICCKDSINQCAGDIRRFFRISIPDQSSPLAERKRALSRLLNRFIQIYQYETVAVLSEHHSKAHKTSRCIEAARFWKFLRTASESQLEDLLSKYTRLHHSVDIFMGRSPDHVSTKGDDSVGDDRLNSRRPRLRPGETFVPAASGMNSSSSDSGFVSVGGLGSEQETPTSSAQKDGIHSARSDLTVINQTHLDSNGGRCSRGSDVSDARLSTWSSCCLTLKCHSSNNNRHAHNSDSKEPTEFQSHTTDNSNCNKNLTKDSVKKLENVRPRSLPSSIVSMKQRLHQRKNNFGIVPGKKKEATESCLSTPSDQPRVNMTNSSSQTARPSVSLRMCRPRYSARRTPSRGPSPMIGRPLMYSTRKRPQTAVNRVNISSHIKPRSTYRNPGMAPLCSFKGHRSTVPMNNHNIYSGKERHSLGLPEKPPAVQMLVPGYEYVDGPHLTRNSSVLIDNEQRPGTCPPVYIPFDAQLYQISPRSHESLIPRASESEEGSHVAGRKPDPVRSLTNPPAFTATNLIKTPSSRRVHPTF